MNELYYNNRAMELFASAGLPRTFRINALATGYKMLIYDTIGREGISAQ